MGGIQAITSWSIAPQHHSISLCSSLPSILWLSSRGTNCYAFAPGERLIQPGWDLSSHEASCHSTTYNISFFLTLSNWCACPLAQEARGYGAQKNGVGMEVTVHWQQVCLHRVFLMRSHKLCASAASDKHTSDATGRSTKKKNWKMDLLLIFTYFKMKWRQNFVQSKTWESTGSLSRQCAVARLMERCCVHLRRGGDLCLFDPSNI